MQEIGLIIIAILVLAIAIALFDHIVKERRHKALWKSIEESRVAALRIIEEKTPLKDDEYHQRRAEILKSLPPNYLDGYNKVLPK